MTILKFPAAPVPDLAPDDEHRGAEITKILLGLTDPGVRARIAASNVTEFLREAYGVYWMDGRARAGVGASMVCFAAELPGLSDDRIEYWMSLARFAVQVEMKHWGDELYALDADHPYEILVDLSDYLPSDDEQLEASKDNRHRWAELAEIATHHAIAEEAFALSQAA
jgi:hypothetical protein